MRHTFSRSVMLSMAVKLGCTKLIFVAPGAKVIEQYYWDMLLMQQLHAVIYSKTMHWHITLVTQTSFSTARHCSSSSLTWGHPTVPTLILWTTASEHDAGTRVPSAHPGCEPDETAVCWDVGWVAAERGGWGHWPIATTTGSMCPCTRWSLWTLPVTLLTFSLPHNTTGFFQSHSFFSKEQTVYFRTDELLLNFTK